MAFYLIVATPVVADFIAAVSLAAIAITLWKKL